MSDPPFLSHPTAMETDDSVHALPIALKRSTSAPMLAEVAAATTTTTTTTTSAATSRPSPFTLTALDLANAPPPPPPSSLSPPPPFRRARSGAVVVSVPSSPSMVVEPRVWELKREGSGIDGCVKQEVAHESLTTLTIQLTQRCEEMNLDSQSLSQGVGWPSHGARSFPSSPVLTSPGGISRRSSFPGFKKRSQSPLLSDRRPDSLALKRKCSDSMEEVFVSPPKRYCNVPSPLLVDDPTLVPGDSDSGRGASPLRQTLFNLHEQSPLNESGTSAAHSSASSSVDGGGGVPALPFTSGSFSMDFSRRSYRFGTGTGFRFGDGLPVSTAGGGSGGSEGGAENEIAFQSVMDS